MMRQKLTPEQYSRANRVLMMVLSVVYVIFIVIEMNAVKDSGMGAIKGLRIALDVISIVAINIFVRLKEDKKSAMLFMSIGDKL